MARELARPEEEAVGRAPGAMMHEMRAPDPAEDPEREERAHRQPPVHEPVVHDHVANPEERHTGTGADEERARVSVELTSDDDEACSDRRVEHGERVVPLEPPFARLVMGPVHAPQSVVPDPPVEKAGPELHRRRHHGSCHYGDEEIGGRPALHEAAP